MSQASRALGIAQPTLSKSISGLEKELGAQLFDRSGKKLILNERGKKFLEGAISTIDELDSAVEAAQDRSIDFTLNLGLFCTSEKLMKCMGDFSRHNLEIIFNVSQLSGSPDHIDTDKYDMLLYPYNTQFRKYKGQSVYSEAYSLAVHRDNPLSYKKSVSISELSETRLVFLRYDKKSYDLPYQLYHNYAAPRRNHMYTNSYDLQRQMISAGCCAGFVPEGCAGTYHTDGNIVILPLDEEEFMNNIYIGFKREKHLNISGKKFAAFVCDYFGV